MTLSRTQTIRMLGSSVLALLLITAGNGCKNQAPEDYSAFVPHGAVADEVSVGGFTMRTYHSHSDDAPGAWDDIGSFEILREGRRVYGQHGVGFYIAGRPRSFDEEAMRTPVPGTDITGNGRPNVVVYEWTGGAHSCFVAYVFELGDRCKMLASINGVDSIPAFTDLNGDSVLEVRLRDCTFRYWPESFGSSPLPEVILRWTGRRYEPDAKLMETPEPSEAELKNMAEKIRSDAAWDRDPSGGYSRYYIPQELFQTALDLMYGGHEELGRRFIEMAWSPKYPLDKKLLSESDALLSESPYWNAIRKQRHAEGLRLETR